MPIEGGTVPLKIHIVKKGDTLGGLSEKYELELSRLASANPQLDDQERLAPGSKVKIPASPVVTPQAKPSGVAGAANQAASALGSAANHTAGALGSAANHTAGALGSAANHTAGALGSAANHTAGALGSVANHAAGALGSVANHAAGALGSVANHAAGAIGSAANHAAGALQPAGNQPSAAPTGNTPIQLSQTVNMTAAQGLGSPMNVAIPAPQGAQAVHPFAQQHIPAVEAASMADYPGMFMPLSAQSQSFLPIGYPVFPGSAAPYTPYSAATAGQQQPCTDCGHPMGTYVYPPEPMTLQSAYGGFAGHQAYPGYPGYMAYPAYPTYPSYPGIFDPMLSSYPTMPPMPGVPSLPGASATPQRSEEEQEVNTAAGAISAPEQAMLSKPAKQPSRKKAKSRTIVRVRSAYTSPNKPKPQTPRRRLQSMPWLNR